MYVFEATYENMDTGKEVTRTIEFDGDHFFPTEKECYLHAMSKAYDMKQRNECFGNLEFIAC